MRNRMEEDQQPPVSFNFTDGTKNIKELHFLKDNLIGYITWHFHCVSSMCVYVFDALKRSL